MEETKEDRMIHFQTLDYLVRESILNTLTSIVLYGTKPETSKGWFGKEKQTYGNIHLYFVFEQRSSKDFFWSTISTLQEYEELRYSILKELIAYFKTEPIVKETNGSNEASNN